MSTGKIRHRLKGNQTDIRMLAFAPDLPQLASVAGEGLRLWNLQTGKQEAHHAMAGAKDAWPYGPLCVTYQQDGKKLVVGLAGGLVWFDPHHPEAKGVEWGLKVNQAAIHTVSRIVISPDQTKLITLDKEKGDNPHTLFVWDIEKRMLMDEVAGHQLMATGIAMGTDSNLLVTSSNDCTIRFWEIPLRKARSTFAALKLPIPAGTLTTLGISATNLSQDGKRLAVGYYNGSNQKTAELRCYDTATKHMVFSGQATLFGKYAEVLTVKLSPTAQRLAVVTGPRYAGSDDNDCCLTLWNVPEQKLIREIRGRFPLRIVDLQFTPDGTQFAVSCGHPEVVFFDSVTGNETRVFKRAVNLKETIGVMGFNFTPDGLSLLTTGG
ncbi:MAG: hypothetical protein QM775_28205 [Pirellulales bacterium]